MKLGSLKSSSKDGRLVVVSKDNKKMVPATDVAENLRTALENWSETRPALMSLYEQLNQEQISGEEIKPENFHSPLPRSFQWIDGSAFIQHIKLVRKSRNAPIPETLHTIPLVYQGSGDSFLAPTEDIPQSDPKHGTDFEGEIGVIVNDVPMGVSPEKALDHIILFVLINDVSLRGLAAPELKRGFGFVQSKPSSSFAPFAVTKEELGGNWKGGRVHLPLLVDFNGVSFGKAGGGAMHFHFGELISHAAKTRRLTAGTIIGSGTVSEEGKGFSCLVEKRTVETIQTGEAKQPFMKPGDQITIRMLDQNGENIFGTISQKVMKAPI
ncbi:MAG: fumarylacetoacetate hydrolase family protein [Bdellovibrionales bacterium]|nr:fumarylacetoacetate hydrolase family protein [Bdellovibrionales bacterium]